MNIDRTIVDNNSIVDMTEQISNLFIAIEELRQSIFSVTKTTATATTATKTTTTTTNRGETVTVNIDHIQEWDYVLYTTIVGPILSLSHRLNCDSTCTSNDRDNNHTISNNADRQTMTLLLLNNVIQKATDLLQTHLLPLCYHHYIEPSLTISPASSSSSNAVEEQRKVGQGCIAHCTEMFIQLLVLQQQQQNGDQAAKTSPSSQSLLTDNDTNFIIQQYSTYQKKVYRVRCKPYIVQLIQIRKENKDSIFQQIPTSIPTTTTLPKQLIATGSEAKEDHNDNDDDEDYNDDENDNVPVITTMGDLSTALTHSTKGGTAAAAAAATNYQQYEPYHAPIMTMILGTAATLIHPLMIWMNQLQQHPVQQQESHDHAKIVLRMCQSSIDMIHEQTLSFIQTIHDWFMNEDRKVLLDYYISQTTTAGNSNMKGDNMVTSNNSISQLNGLINEMITMTQIIQQYSHLIDTFDSNRSRSSSNSEDRNTKDNKNSNLHDTLSEWIWQYSTYERILVLQQWKFSIRQTSQPVCIIIGTSIYVSSCIEDIQYISNQAIDRATSIQSIDAISTVLYFIVHDIWSTTSPNTDLNGMIDNYNDSTTLTTTVYDVLLREIGCALDYPTTAENQSNSKNGTTASMSSPNSGGGGSNAFASALLDALDEDLGTTTTNSVTSTMSTSTTPTKQQQQNVKSPSSGGFILSSLMNVLEDSTTNNVNHSKVTKPQTQQSRLDTNCILLNSIYAAYSACRCLTTIIDDILLDYTDDDVDKAGATVTNDNSNNSNNHNNAATMDSAAAAAAAATQKAVEKVQLSRDDVIQYSKDYYQLLVRRMDEAIHTWCYAANSSSSIISKGYVITNGFVLLEEFFRSESYHIMDGTTYSQKESDEQLLLSLITVPFQQHCTFLQQVICKSDTPILLLFSERVASFVVDMILNIIWGNDHNESISNDKAAATDSKSRPNGKRFTDWGALLLSKQSRMLQHYISTTLIRQTSSTTLPTTNSNITATNVMHIWERLSSVITILQLEKPMDYISYYCPTTAAASKQQQQQNALTPDEIYKTLLLRVDFSSDAIEKVVSIIRSTNNIHSEL